MDLEVEGEKGPSMYHDEFAKKPAKPISDRQAEFSSLPLEFGGGLSLGLAASLNQPLSMLVFYLGGLLPLVTCCLSISVQRASEWLASLAPSLKATRPSALPVPHLYLASSRSATRLRPLARVSSAR